MEPVNQKIMAEILGLTPRYLRDLEEQGIIPRLEDGKYSVPDTVQSFVEFKTKTPEDASLIQERTRLVKVQADRKELELARARGELLNTAKAMELWGAVCQNIRSKILAIPVKTAPLLFALKSIPEIKERLEKACHEILAEISNPNLEETARNIEKGNILKPGETIAPKKRR
jgi:phage terminase Nu1 subunit (DNA packaging protein)